ncbi:MAG: 50S ribosome-binding GTPase, partial [Alcanivoracaceae bacterium]|nr:50S ribosome-binding GTPase [Alcanivoracaceae bacterium]
NPKNDEHSSSTIFHITYPLSSVKIVEILNKASEVIGLGRRSLFPDKNFFSLKNIFSKFISSNKNIALHTKSIKNKSYFVANKLLNLRHSDMDTTLKVVLLGTPNSGKTTAITSASTSKILTSEVRTTDSITLLKEQTTIGIDYGECQFDNGNRLRLYGTPGQERYSYVQLQTVAGADIYIILIDLSSTAPFAEFMYYKKIIESTGNDDALRVVAFTHYDQKRHNMSQLSKEIRCKYHGEILTVKIDTRQKNDVRSMLSRITKMKLGMVHSEHHYKENNLFLKANS